MGLVNQELVSSAVSIEQAKGMALGARPSAICQGVCRAGFAAQGGTVCFRSQQESAQGVRGRVGGTEPKHDNLILGSML